MSANLFRFYGPSCSCFKDGFVVINMLRHSPYVFCLIRPSTRASNYHASRNIIRKCWCSFVHKSVCAYCCLELNLSLLLRSFREFSLTDLLTRNELFVYVNTMCFVNIVLFFFPYDINQWVCPWCHVCFQCVCVSVAECCVVLQKGFFLCCNYF